VKQERLWEELRMTQDLNDDYSLGEVMGRTGSHLRGQLKMKQMMWRRNGGGDSD
jgi:hypothetical protein